MTRKFSSILVISVLLLALGLSGCSPTREISEAIQPTSAESVAQPEQNISPLAATETEPAIEEPLAEAQELVSTGEQGFIQDGSLGVFLFAVNNPNSGYAIESSEYQITIYDASGTVLSTSSGYISLVLPEEKLFIAEDFYLEEGQTADRIEVQINSGSAKELELAEAPFSVDQVEFVPDEWFPQVTGMVNNHLNRDVSEMRITAVAYDANGNIIGGGSTYLNFLPPNGKSAVDISVTVDQTPAKVEIYPTVSGLSVFTEVESSEGGLILIDYGIVQSEYTSGVAFLIQNTNATSALESSEYRVEAYDEAGTVLDTEEGYINLVYPGEKQAVFTDLYIPTGAMIAKVEVQLKQGDSTSTEFAQNPLTAEKISLQAGDFDENVTAIISNAAERAFEDLEVVAVGYDETGKIVGGGYTYLDFVHAEDSSGVQISYNGDQEPSSIEVYPSISSMSLFGTANTDEIVELVDSGYGQDGASVGVGFMVQNTDTNSAVESTRYIATAYDAEGYVLASSSGYIDLLFPEQIIADQADLYLPTGKTPDRIEVQFLSGESVAAPTSGYPFSVENVNFVTDGYFPKVTGTVNSSLSTDVEYVNVIAIAFDAEGKIIGSGSTSLEFIPANGQAAVEVLITCGEIPARVELYANFSSLSNLAD